MLLWEWLGIFIDSNFPMNGFLERMMERVPEEGTNLMRINLNGRDIRGALSGFTFLYAWADLRMYFSSSAGFPSSSQNR